MPALWTRDALARHLAALGLRPGDVVLVHAGLRSVGPIYFEEVVEDFLATGQGRRGLIGYAPSVLVDAPAIVAFAVQWLERRFRRQVRPTPLPREK